MNKERRYCIMADKQNTKMYTYQVIPPDTRIYVSKLTSLSLQIMTDLDGVSLSHPDFIAQTAALCVQPAGPLPYTSAEWLKTHGLRGVHSSPEITFKRTQIINL